MFISLLWSRGVARWRDAPFPLPAHQTGRAVFPHPASGQGVSHVRPRTLGAPSSAELKQPQLLVKVGLRVACLARTLYLKLRAQPLTYPLADMSVDAPVRFADGPDAEVLGPTPELGVDPPYLLVDLQISRPTRRHLMDLAAMPRDFLPAWAGAQIRLARPAVIVPTQGKT